MAALLFFLVLLSSSFIGINIGFLPGASIFSFSFIQLQIQTIEAGISENIPGYISGLFSGSIPVEAYNKKVIDELDADLKEALAKYDEKKLRQFITQYKRYYRSCDDEGQKANFAHTIARIYYALKEFPMAYLYLSYALEKPQYLNSLNVAKNNEIAIYWASKVYERALTGAYNLTRGSCKLDSIYFHRGDEPAYIPFWPRLVQERILDIDWSDPLPSKMHDEFRCRLNLSAACLKQSYDAITRIHNPDIKIQNTEFKKTINAYSKIQLWSFLFNNGLLLGNYKLETMGLKGKNSNIENKVNFLINDWISECRNLYIRDKKHQRKTTSQFQIEGDFDEHAQSGYQLRLTVRSQNNIKLQPLWVFPDHPDDTI